MKISNETKIGIVAALSILILILGYNFIVGNDLFSEEKVFYAKYDQIDGLKTANPVFIHGYKVGKVESINLKGVKNPELVVKFSVKNNVDVPAGSTAQIFSSDILGSKAVKIIPGKATASLNSGDTIASDQKLSFSESINKMIDPVQKKTVSLITSLDSVITAFKSIMNEGAKEDIQSTFTSLSSSIKNLERTTSRLDTLVEDEQKRLRKIFSHTEEITSNLKENNEKISRSIENISKISDSLAASKLKSTLLEANQAINNLNTITKKVNKGEGSIGQLVNNDELYDNLKNASNNVDELVKDLNNNPGKYINFSLFRFGNGKDENNSSDEEMENSN